MEETVNVVGWKESLGSTTPTTPKNPGQYREVFPGETL